MRQRLIDYFAGQQAPLQKQLADQRAAQQAAEVKRFLGQKPETANTELEAFLSRTAGAEQAREVAALANLNSAEFDNLGAQEQRKLAAAAATPLGQAREIQAAQAVRDRLGLDMQSAAALQQGGLKGLMAAQGGQARADIAREYARRQAPGLAQGFTDARLGVVNVLADSTWKGDLARAGLVGGVTGGGVLGAAALTEGAQQLIALMEYLKGGKEAEDRAANSPLA